MSQLIGIFGGTFDPVHQGHLNCIKLLDQAIKFERVHWVLSARPPHKNQVSASIEHRYAMLQLALNDFAHYQPDDTEISRADKSYTIDTIEHFKQLYPQAKLCLIIGSDSMHNLHTWHRYQELIEQVNLIILHRPGYAFEVPDYLQSRILPSAHELANVNAGKLVLFGQSAFDISSTALRQALTEGFPSKLSQSLVRQYIAKPVIDYINQHRLYKTC